MKILHKILIVATITIGFVILSDKYFNNMYGYIISILVVPLVVWLLIELYLENKV
jgi:hypothetical protein